MTRNEYSRTYAEQIRTYKANMRMLELSVKKAEAELRMYDNRLTKAELRIEQLMVLLKQLLDLVINRAKKKETRVSPQEIIGYIDTLVKQYTYLEQEKPTADLVEEIYHGTIGINPSDKNDKV